jgi:hypothetical protein
LEGCIGKHQESWSQTALPGIFQYSDSQENPSNSKLYKFFRADYLDSAGELRDWAGGFIAGARTDTLSLLKDISNGVAAQIAYEERED